MGGREDEGPQAQGQGNRVLWQGGVEGGGCAHTLTCTRVMGETCSWVPTTNWDLGRERGVDQGHSEDRACTSS